ncbi:MAG: hypothetical protein EAZ15_09390 [Sphingobacteriales bacterium]|nr:MAG: hypothetical protein EAZ15_09390 [Sphingobacteriales bacterium]
MLKALTMKNEYTKENTILDTDNEQKGLNQVLFNCQNINQNQVYIAHIITAFICKIALGIEPCLHLNDLLLQNNAQTDQKKLIDFCLLVQNQNCEKAEFNDNLEITLRDFLKMAFAELGVEIEFSGKNHYEKGVIIDVDESLANKLGLNLDFLKQGQTVVKIDVNFNHLQMPQNVFLQDYIQVTDSINLQNVINLSILTHLQIINSINI